MSKLCPSTRFSSLITLKNWNMWSLLRLVRLFLKHPHYVRLMRQRGPFLLQNLPQRFGFLLVSIAKVVRPLFIRVHLPGLGHLPPESRTIIFCLSPPRPPSGLPPASAGWHGGTVLPVC